MKTGTLADIIRWSHLTLAEILEPGDFAVDLTVGNGKDTLFLWNAVGNDGCVIGFDIQMSALQKAESFLQDAGAEVTLYKDETCWEFPRQGIHLICADHARLKQFISSSPRAVIANLGYLPSSNPEVVTQVPSTIVALETGLKSLSSGGRLAVVCYVGHPGGREEARAVEDLFIKESPDRFYLLRIGNPLPLDSPFLIVAEKIAI